MAEKRLNNAEAIVALPDLKISHVGTGHDRSNLQAPDDTGNLRHHERADDPHLLAVARHERDHDDLVVSAPVRPQQSRARHFYCCSTRTAILEAALVVCAECGCRPRVALPIVVAALGPIFCLAGSGFVDANKQLLSGGECSSMAASTDRRLLDGDASLPSSMKRTRTFKQPLGTFLGQQPL